MKKLSIIMPTVRRKDAFYEEKPNQHIFENLFNSIEDTEAIYRDQIEIIIVDGCWEYRNLQEELAAIKQWSFDYKVVKPKDSFWRQNKMFHMSSSLNSGFIHSQGEFVHFIIDMIHFPDGYFKKYFTLLENGYLPMPLYFHSHGKKLLLTQHKLNSKPFEYDEKSYYLTNCSVSDLFDYFKSSQLYLHEFVLCDPRTFDVCKDLQNGKNLTDVGVNMFFGLCTVSSQDFIDLNGYDENFDGHKGCCDIELGVRLYRMKNIKNNSDSKYRMCKDLYCFNNIKKPYDSNVIRNPQYTCNKTAANFIDGQKFFNYIYAQPLIEANNGYNIDCFNDFLLETNDVFLQQCANYFINYRPNFKIKDQMVTI